MAAVGGGIETPSDNILAMVQDFTGAGIFQQVDAAQQGGFTGTGSADDGGHVALFDGKVNVPENFVGTEGLAQVTHFNDVVFHISGLPSCFSYP